MDTLRIGDSSLYIGDGSSFRVGGTATVPFMVAAELVEGTIYGYSVLDPDLTGIPLGGSLSKEPVEGETVLTIISQFGTLLVSMDGDVSEDLFGKSVWIDGVEYIPPDSNNNWGYTGSLFGTFYSAPIDSDFVPNQSYRVVIDSATFTSIRLQSIGGVLKYSDGSIGDPGGALSKQPLEGYDLAELRYEDIGGDKTIVASFSGDASHLSEVYTIFIDGEEFLPDGSDWVYDSGNDITVYEGVGSVEMKSGANHIVHVKQKPAIDPASLFANGEDGALLDPSNLGTLFQDNVLTPAAVPGDPVGMILDTRLWDGKTLEELLADQPELWTNPTPAIANNSGTAGRYDDETMTMYNVGNAVIGFPRFAFNLGLTSGALYYVEGKLSGSIDKLLQLRLALVGSDNNVPYNASTGEFKGFVKASSNSIQFLLSTFDNTWVSETDFLTIDELSIKEVPGNHAIQETLASKPTLQQDDGNWYLQDDGVNDSLNVTLPEDDYTRVYVDADGVVTIDEEVAISGTENILQVPQLAGILYINRALTDDEKAGLTVWWKL